MGFASLYFYPFERLCRRFTVLKGVTHNHTVVVPFIQGLMLVVLRTEQSNLSTVVKDEP